MKLPNKVILPGLGEALPGDITIEETKSFGTLYFKKYSIKYKNTYYLFAFASKTKGFNSICGVAFFDDKFQIQTYMELNPNVEFNVVLGIIETVITEKPSVKINKDIERAVQTLPQRSRTTGDSGPVSTIFQNIIVIGTFIAGVVSSGVVLSLIRNWRNEKKFIKIEDEINKYLFRTQRKNETAFSIYSTLNLQMEQFLKKKYNGLIITGPPGMSKTYMIRRHLYFSNLKAGKDYVLIKGAALEPRILHDIMYKHRTKIIILDDFIMSLDETDINTSLLKAATDTYHRRVITLDREKKIAISQAGGTIYLTPEKFEFTGSIIICTNIEPAKIPKSLASRMPIVEVFFNCQEILQYINKMMGYMVPSLSPEGKQEVIDFVDLLYRNDKNITLDFRIFESAFEARRVNPKWKDQVKLIVGYKGPTKLVERYLNQLYVGG